MPRHWSSTTAYAFLSWVLFVSATTLEKVTQQGWCLWSPLQSQLIHTGDALEIRGFPWVVGPHFRGLTSRFLLTGPVLQGQDEGLPGAWWSHRVFHWKHEGPHGASCRITWVLEGEQGGHRLYHHGQVTISDSSRLSSHLGNGRRPCFFTGGMRV